ncbi:hypothetical protein BKA66DRAFT_476599 [Pyrenochaeta sp. MPI-SDFR-AT-0127]|nr:hypothetical protein BKA66DRAFT_476599 [Pyrenochaeta sp. MPI-SDFR-AT-0127]
MRPTLNLTTMTSIFLNPLLRGYPLSYKSHTLVCLSLGTLMSFRPSLLLTNPLWIKLHHLFGLAYIPPSRASSPSSTLASVEIQHWSNLGILITAIGVINVAAASVPGGRSFAGELANLRIGAALLTAVVWAIKPESRDLVKALIMLEDGVGGLITGWQMGLWV